MKNAVLWDLTPGALVKTDVSEDIVASIIRMERTSELGTLATISSYY
jgi:hypothetical protein